MSTPRPKSYNVRVNSHMSDVAITNLAKRFSGFLGVTRTGDEAFSCFDSQENANAYKAAGGPPAP